MEVPPGYLTGRGEPKRSAGRVVVPEPLVRRRAFGGEVSGIHDRSWRLTTGLFLGIAIGIPACGESGDSEPARSAPAVVAQDRVADQEDGMAADTERAGLARQTRIRVAGREVTVEVADTPDARSQGLMHRDSLPEDYGMLFVYPEEQILSFWMRNTRIPLDIAFIDRSGFILEIQHMEPHDDTSHASRQPAMYALELRSGWFEDHGVEPGDRVEF